MLFEEGLDRGKIGLPGKGAVLCSHHLQRACIGAQAGVADTAQVGQQFGEHAFTAALAMQSVQLFLAVYPESHQSATHACACRVLDLSRFLAKVSKKYAACGLAPLPSAQARG